jgi:cytoskeletal protein CcmA (bactofilin family)
MHEKRAILNILGKGTVFNGTLQTEGGIRIDGSFEGKMNVQDMIIIGKSGLIKGNIRTKDAIIAGEIIGDIRSSGRLEFHAGSKITGDIACKRLIVEEGVIFDGSCKMSDKKAKISTDKRGQEVRNVEPAVKS